MNFAAKIAAIKIMATITAVVTISTCVGDKLPLFVDGFPVFSACFEGDIEGVAARVACKIGNLLEVGEFVFGGFAVKFVDALGFVVD